MTRIRRFVRRWWPVLIYIAAMATLLVVLQLHHRYVCFTWGKPGQLRTCRVYK